MTSDPAMTVPLNRIVDTDTAGLSTLGSASEGSSSHSTRRVPSRMSLSGDEDDDESDISMSADSEDSEDESVDGNVGHTSQIIVRKDLAESVPVGRKRKLSVGLDGTEDGPLYTGRGDGFKRTRIDLRADPAYAKFRNQSGRLLTDRSLLPMEIWHHVFAFTHPRALGRSMQVSKVFKNCLDSSSSPKSFNLASLSVSVVHARTPEAIWQASRRRYYPKMPSPLQDFTELEMWRLACNPSCQTCQRKGIVVSTAAQDQFHSGPGQDGVCAIWAFGIRACGPCLQTRTVKVGALYLDISYFSLSVRIGTKNRQEIELLVSDFPSPLIAALPFIFITAEFHIASAAVLQQGPPPANIQISKCFLTEHVDAIKAEFVQVKSMGPGTTEEWLKGLEERGRSRKNDAAKWERWELNGGVERMQRTIPLEASESFSMPKGLPAPLRNMGHTEFGRPVNGNLPPRHLMPNTGLPLPVSAMPSQPSIHAPFGKCSIPVMSWLLTNGISAVNTPPRFNSPAQNGLPFPPRHFQQPRQEKTREEVAELKAARRAEIERRCLLLNPPITSAVLSHMTSFQAAIQIIKPLDDAAWEVLKPRLLSQRNEAEQREKELIAQNRIVQEKYDERRLLDTSDKETKELNEMEWDEIQAPLRARIGGYAEEIIRDGWAGGDKVNKETCSRFAADVLIYVRKRFYAEVAKDDAATRAAGREPVPDPPNGPFTRKLILENMKWVFDTKIKPLTDPYSKELFLCSACENNFKYYGFEGVIQHYAAKHTSALSVGSIVVHWRAEWPESPPFNPEPGYSPTVFPPTSKPPSMYGNGPGVAPVVQVIGGYPPSSGPMAPPSHVSQSSHGYGQVPVGYYGPPQYHGQYAGPPAGQFVQPGPLQSQNAGFQGPPFQGAPPGGYQPYPTQGYSAPSYNGHYSSGAALPLASPLPGQVHPVVLPEQPLQHAQTYPHAAAPQTGGSLEAANYPGSQYPATQYDPIPRPATAFRTEEYKAQLHVVALAAREVWNHTAGVKDMPGSVRVYVVLYHILKRFRTKFSKDPPLKMLIDGLSNNKDMRPVRNVNGLSCRACKMEQSYTGRNQRKGAGKGSGAEKKQFSFPQLLNHFQSVHIEGLEYPRHDWTQDMVELPDPRKITALARSPGMDHHKMQLLKEALPDAFRTPTPEFKPEPARDIYSSTLPEEDARRYDHLAPSRDNQHTYYTVKSEGRYTSHDRSYVDGRGDRAMEVSDHRPIILPSAVRHQYEDHPRGEHQVPHMTYLERRIEPLTTAGGNREYDQRNQQDGREYYRSPGLQYPPPEQVYRGRRDTQPDMIIRPDQPPSANDHGYEREVSLPRLLEMTERLAAASPKDQAFYHTANETKGRRPPSRPISDASQVSKRQPHLKVDAGDGVSGNGELRAEPLSVAPARTAPMSAEARNDAERFLSAFEPGQSLDEYARSAQDSERLHRELRSETLRLPPANNDRPAELKDARARYERPPQRIEAHGYEERYIAGAQQAHLARRRSPEIKEEPLDADHSLYRYDRQTAALAPPVTTRYARYEDPRYESGRARSRSPVYVRVGASSTQYLDRSPPTRYAEPEPIYRTRTPSGTLQEVVYERAPRHEYYLYADEQRGRPAYREEPVQYVFADHGGEYLTRRSVRREHEPVYARYDDDATAGRPLGGEARAPAPRIDPAYDEEYDPRHPEPPPGAIRQVRYQ